jgi:Uma2 family endonuclease
MSTTTDIYTFRDFLQTVGENDKAHLLDGIIVMESPASFRHEELQSFLNAMVNAYARRRQLGRVFGSNAAFKLDDHNVVEPDVSFLGGDRPFERASSCFDGAPDLAIEIVSKGTRRIDYDQKKPAYEKAGTRELWIIDYLREQADFFALDEGRFGVVPLDENQRFHSRVLAGLYIDVAWLWADPLPDVMDILNELLR